MKNNTKAEQQKTVVALQFDGVNAPTVSAKGSGLTGEHILQVAREHGIPLHENSSLAKALSCIPLGEEIPPEMFAIVAEVLAYIYFIDEIHSNEQEL